MDVDPFFGRAQVLVAYHRGTYSGLAKEKWYIRQTTFVPQAPLAEGQSWVCLSHDNCKLDMVTVKDSLIFDSSKHQILNLIVLQHCDTRPVATRPDHKNGQKASESTSTSIGPKMAKKTN